MAEVSVRPGNENQASIFLGVVDRIRNVDDLDRGDAAPHGVEIPH
jgi:hypothetical protein